MIREIQLTDFTWARNLLAKIAYKPGWELKIDEDLYSPHEMMLKIQFVVEDTYHRGRMVRIAMVETLPYYIVTPRDDKKFIRYIFDTLIKAEKHEASEWFKVDGVMVYDPHKK